MIYLDNAATSFPKPAECLRRALERYLQLGASPGRGGYDLAVEAEAAVSTVREDLAVVYGKLVPVAMLQSLARRGIEWVVVDDEEYVTLGCNILAVRPGVVLMGERNVRTADALREKGVEVHTFVSERRDKGEGGPTCMTRPILRA